MIFLQANTLYEVLFFLFICMVVFFISGLIGNKKESKARKLYRITYTNQHNRTTYTEIAATDVKSAEEMAKEMNVVKTVLSVKEVESDQVPV